MSFQSPFIIESVKLPTCHKCGVHSALAVVKKCENPTCHKLICLSVNKQSHMLTCASGFKKGFACHSCAELHARLFDNQDTMVNTPWNGGSGSSGVLSNTTFVL